MILRKRFLFLFLAIDPTWAKPQQGRITDAEAKQDCILVRNSFFCVDEAWSEFWLDLQLAVFDGAGPLTPQNADAELEEVVRALEDRLPQKAECGNRFDLVRARTYNCHTIIASSHERCNNFEPAPKKVCRSVCEQYLNSGVSGLEDGDNCPNRTTAEKWLAAFEKTTDCSGLSDDDCVGEDMEQDTCGYLTVDSMCRNCEFPSQKFLQHCPPGTRDEFAAQDAAAAGGTTGVIIGVSVGAVVLILLAAIGGTYYWRVIRKNKRLRDSAIASAKGIPTAPSPSSGGLKKSAAAIAPSYSSPDNKQGMPRENLSMAGAPVALPPVTTPPIDHGENKIGKRASSLYEPASNLSGGAGAVAAAVAFASPIHQERDSNDTSHMSMHSRPPSSQNLSRYNIEPTKYVVIYQYTHRQPDEMDLVPGQHVMVQTLYDDGWALGRNESTGVEGALPQACIVPLLQS